MTKKRISELDILTSIQGNEVIAIDDTNQQDSNGNPITKKLEINNLYANAKIIEEPAQNSSTELQISVSQYSDVMLFINGVLQKPGADYIIAGNIITLSTTIENDDNIQAIIFA